jgi:hypothetical protein
MAGLVACGSPQIDKLVRYDSGADASVEGGTADGGSDIDPDLGGPCTDDGQCDDALACTFDKCDTMLGRCRNTPDDSLCDDGVFCNGKERCVHKLGCAAGPVVSCDDPTPCTIDRCIEATKACEHAPRDADKDGDPDDHCYPNKDCDDLDPNVSSLRVELCGNGKDDNCNGQVDELGCVNAANATCQTALAIGGPGTYVMSTVAAPKSFSASCGVSKPNAAHDVVAKVTIPQGPNRDLDVWATSADKNEVAVAVFSTCGQSQSELGCGAGQGAWMTRTRARNLAPGTYTVVVTSQGPTSVELRVDFLTPTPKAPNEDCGAPIPITPGVATKVEIIDPSTNLPTACPVGTGELTYSFTLAQPQDVHVFTQTLFGSGVPVVGLRAPSCSGQNDELRCRAGTMLPLLARDQPAGTYVLTVAASSPIDAQVLVQLSAPTQPPPGQTCNTAPAATVNGTLGFDLSTYEDAIKDGCLSGGPTASWKVDLAQPSDVMLVGRFPQIELGAVSLDAAGCTVNDKLVCTAAYTPVRVSKRNVPAGSYRAVVTDQYGQIGSLTTLVRPTVAPINVTTADTCQDFVDIPAQGGFLQGDTTGKNAEWDESCDAANLPMGGAPDQIFRLVLAQPKRVVINMDGSVFPTILSVRKGAQCPGLELANGCNVGFGASRSFLDATLSADTYWIAVDGYGMQKGAWNLDIRVIDP